MFVRWLERMPFLDEDQDQGGKRERVKPTDLLSQYGSDAVRMAEKLADVQNDNADYRIKNNALRRDNEALKSQTIPDGAVVLTGDDASRWQAYQALEQTPEQIAQALKDANDATARLSELQRKDTIRDVAGLVNYDPDILMDRGGALEYEVREIETDGRKARVPFVKDGANVVPLTDYAQREWPKYLPALAAHGAAQSSGTSFVPQTGGTGQAVNSIDEAFKRRHEARSTTTP